MIWTSSSSKQQIITFEQRSKRYSDCMAPINFCTVL